MLLRPYQRGLVDKARAGNSIIVLPTGSGKTVIAAHIIKEIYLPDKITVFLVPTSVLVDQQAIVLENASGLKIARLVGGKSCNMLGYQVLVATPVAFLQLPQINILWARINLVVFDEVHHCIKNHPYRLIAKEMKLLKSPPPTILGLTATLSYAVDYLRIEKTIQNIMDDLLVDNILTCSKEDMEGFASNMTNILLSSLKSFEIPNGSQLLSLISIRSSHVHPITYSLWATIHELENDIITFDANFASPLCTLFPAKAEEWSKYANLQKIKFEKKDDNLSQLYLKLFHLYEAFRLIASSQQKAIELAIEYLKFASVFSTLDIPWDTHKKSFSQLSSLRTALLMLHSASFHGIVFVQQRLICHVIHHFINSDPDLCKLYNPTLIYATSSAATPLLSLSPTKFQSNLYQFTSRACNLLISTAVCEEGLDVSAANCVIRFNPVQNSVSMQQSRGRARQENSKFITLDDNGKDFELARTYENHVIQNLTNQQASCSNDRIIRNISKFLGPESVAFANLDPLSRINLLCQSLGVVMEEDAAIGSGTFWTKRVFLVLEDVLYETHGNGSSKQLAKHDAGAHLARYLVDKFV